MEIICKLLGMIITFVPSVYFAIYMIKRATAEQKFDLHIRRVKDKARNLGVFFAFVNRFLLFCLITSLGLYIVSYFTNNWALDIIIISLIVYIISFYVDNTNDF